MEEASKAISLEEVESYIVRVVIIEVISSTKISVSTICIFPFSKTSVGLKGQDNCKFFDLSLEGKLSI